MADEDENSISLLSKSEEDTGQPNYDAIFGQDGPNLGKFAQPTMIGDVRNPRRFSWVEWTFLTLSLIAFSGTLGMTFERLVYFSKHNLSINDSSQHGLDSCDSWTCTSDYTFTIVLIMNLVFCFFYAIDGVVRERGFEVLAVPIAISVVIIYLIVNIIHTCINEGHQECHRPIKVARLILAVIFGPPLCIFAIIIYIRMGKLQFNIVGSNKVLMRAYRLRSLLTTLLTFNLQVVVNVVILAWLRNGTFLNEAEKISVLVFAAYIIIITPIGWFGIMYELIWLTSIFIIFFLPTVAYYIYKIVNVALNYTKYYSKDYDTDEGSSYIYVAIALFVVCGLGIIGYGLIICLSLVSMTTYNKGLKEKIQPPFYWCYLKVFKTGTVKRQSGQN